MGAGVLQECEQLVSCECSQKSPEFVSLHTHTLMHGRIQIHTHTQPSNPPLLLTNERIITFADMWRGGGEAERGALSTSLSKR